MTTAPASTAVYLDHNATTPIAPEVLDAMRPYLEHHFGNPSSAHGYGAAAHKAVAGARSEVATLLGCEPGSVVFTASGSEADNLAIKGVALARAERATMSSRRRSSIRRCSRRAAISSGAWGIA